jgi:hypothetical protein
MRILIVLKKSVAFTMIEAILVTALFSMLSLTIFQAFANGLDIWRYGTVDFPEEDIAIFIDKLETDSRNAFVHSLVKFKGSEHSLEYATRIFAPKDPKRTNTHGDYHWQIGKTRFYFDPIQKVIFRQMAPYGLALKGRFLQAQPIARNIRSLRFQYFYHEEEGFVQKKEPQDDLPSVIIVAIEYSLGSDTRRMVRMISLPAGTGLKNYENK